MLSAVNGTALRCIPLLPLLLMLVFCETAAQVTDTTFFNDAWQPCARDTALYYRTVEPMEDSLYCMYDHYRNGALQMVAGSRRADTLIECGPAVFYDSRGYPTSEGFYVEGVHHGSWRNYYPHYVVRDDRTYQLGRLVGPWRGYYPDGAIWDSVYYGIDERPHGVRLRWYGARHLYDSVWYDSLGRRRGVYTQWYDWGQVAATGTYRDDTLNGRYITWHEEGARKRSGSYAMGGRVGEWTSWYPDGAVDSRCRYSENGTISECTYFLPDGTHAAYEKMRDDTVELMAEYWNPDGKPMTDRSRVKREAVAVGGWNDMLTQIRRRLHYPEEARSKGIEGTVELELTILSDGRVLNYRVLRSPADVLTKEAIRVAGEIGDWTPAYEHNRPVTGWVRVPVRFVLN